MKPSYYQLSALNLKPMKFLTIPGIPLLLVALADHESRVGLIVKLILVAAFTGGTVFLLLYAFWRALRRHQLL